MWSAVNTLMLVVITFPYAAVSMMRTIWPEASRSTVRTVAGGGVNLGNSP